MLHHGGRSFPFNSSFRRAYSTDTLLLIRTKPRLLRFTHNAFREEVHQQTNDDEHEGNRVHPMHVQVQDLRANGDTPEVHRQQANVEKCGRGKPEYYRGDGIEDGQHQRVSSQVAANSAIPGRCFER